MNADDITQIIIAGQRTGIIGLKKTLEEVARKCAGRADGEITNELMRRLSKRNYIVPKVKDAYETAFLREYKKFVANRSKKPSIRTWYRSRCYVPDAPNANAWSRTSWP